MTELRMDAPNEKQRRFLLDRHRERILDMQIMELRNSLYPECECPLSRAEVHRAVMQGAPARK